MDLSLLMASLGVLISSLVELRNISKEKAQDQIRPLGISFLQLLLVLDEIIKAGRELIEILSNIPIDDDKSRTDTIIYKGKILKLINKQIKNLDDFVKYYNTPMHLATRSEKPVKVGNAIELYVEDQTEKIKRKKDCYLRVLTWKLLKNEAPLSRIFIAAKQSLVNLTQSTEIDDRRAHMSIQSPSKIVSRVVSIGYRKEIEPKLRSEIKESAVYDLTKPRDLRMLLQEANKQLEEIYKYRNQLSEFISNNYKMSDLL